MIRPRSIWPLYILLAAAWAVLLLSLLPASAQEPLGNGLGNHSDGHDWYREQRDPQFSASGCCDNDCAEVSIESVTPVPEGFRLRLTADEASRVAGATTGPVDAIIPWHRVQPVPKGKRGMYHACIMAGNRDLPRGGVRCFFASPTM